MWHPVGMSLDGQSIIMLIRPLRTTCKNNTNNN